MNLFAESLKGVLSFFPWDDDWNSHMYPDDESIEKDLDLAYEAGIEIIRMDFLWDQIERTKGEFDFSKWDRLVSLVKKKKFKILGVLGYSALWANKSGQWNHPPSNPQDFADFCYQVVNRYKEDLQYWEVWNEPNISFYFVSDDWAVEYVPILKAAYVAIKKADSNAFVLHGGLGQGTVESLEKLYRQGAKDYFDIANIHPFYNPCELSKRPYSKIIDLDVMQSLQVMDKYGDKNKSIWITEIGCPGVDGKRVKWSSLVKEGWFMGESPSLKLQADFLEDIFDNTVLIERVGAVFWAFLRDTRHFKDDVDYFGIIDWAGKKKRSFFSF